MIANNAQQIIDARMQGFKPDEMVLVSLVGRISEPNHTVLADPKLQYDWRWVHGLEICIYITASIDWRPVTRAIAGARPRFLGLWDLESKRGANVYLIPTEDDIGKPIRQWLYKLDFLSWMDFQNREYAACN